MTELVTLPAALDWLPAEKRELEPQPRLNLVEWASRHFVLDAETSALPGRFDWQKSLAMVEPACRLSDVRVREVTIQGPTQFGKSTLAGQFLGWLCDEDPAPALMVMPREEDVRRRVNVRLRPMFRSSPRLASIVPNPDVIHHGMESNLGGMLLYLGWATSAITLSDNPVGAAILDEIDKFEPLAGETDQVNLVRNRMGTFEFSKLLMTSSPTTPGSLIEREYLAGDRRRLWIRCPECGSYHVAEWEHVQLDHGEDGHLLPATSYADPALSAYVCPSCGIAAENDVDRYQRWVGDGVWAPDGCRVVGVEKSVDPGEPVTPALSCRDMLERVMAGHPYNECTADEASALIVGELPPEHRCSYQLGSLVLCPQLTKSATVSVLAQEFAEAREAQRSGDDAPRQNFRNNREGQVWVLTGQRAEEERLAEHCEAWNDHRVPVGVDRVVYAVDVQRDHVWAGIIGWGYAYAAYLIAVDRIETGPLERIENWDPVLAWLREPVTDGVEEGRLWHPQMRMIDSGDGMLTDVIYQACLEADVPVWPSKGDSNVPRNRYWRVRDLDRRPSRRGKKSAGGLKLYEYQPDVYKDRVARFMTATKPGAGYLHLPRLGDGFPPTHLRQLCAEEPVQVRRGGGVINQWQLRRGRRDNHVFDLMVMATMMADVIGVRRIPNPAGQSDDAAVASQPATYRPRWAR